MLDGDFLALLALIRKVGRFARCRAHLGGGSDAEGVVAAAHDLRNADALQRLDGARLHGHDLCPFALPALPIGVATPGDDILRRDRHRVIRPAKHSISGVCCDTHGNMLFATRFLLCSVRQLNIRYVL